MKAREAAFRIVHGVLFKKAYSNIALEQSLNQNNYDSKDSGFITEIVLGTLRNKLLLEFIIAGYSKIKVKKISPSAMSAMLIGAYQILFLDRTPDSAACNESVKIASKFAGQRVRGFVNAILRNISREKTEVWDRIDRLEGERGLSVRYSVCPEAVTKLIKQYGIEKTTEILENINRPAQLCIRFNDNDSEEFHEKTMENLGVDFSKGNISATAFYPRLNGPATGLEIYKDGAISIQDEGAQAMGLFVSPEPGTDVLDACASPGGKTVHMAVLMNGSGRITACDIHPHRVENMKKSISRSGIENISCMTRDMTKEHSEFNNAFDTVLLDVPCSGLGTAQRRPEIKLFYKEDPSLYELQEKIIEGCSEYVRPGGQLIYGTCTLFKEENRDMVDAFLSKRKDFELVDEKTILPDGRTGGFYMAKLVRKKDELT